MPERSFWLGLSLGALALGVAASQRRSSLRRQRWRKAMASLESRAALVTGASSGIGAAYARRLASLGYDLILVARREERLKAQALLLKREFGVATQVLAADLSTPQGAQRVEERILAHGKIEFLVNAAGYGVYGNFAETSIEEQVGMIHCHTVASVRFCRAALPGMLARGRGAIVNVSSVAAFIPKSKDVLYCATKASLNAFSEALQMELAGTQVRVQALCPGFTRTEFHDHPQYAAHHVKERIPAWLWMAPEEVVTASLKALGAGGVICVPGWPNRLIAAAGRVGLTSFFLNRFGGLFEWA